MSSIDIALKLNKIILKDQRVVDFKEIELEKQEYTDLTVLEEELKNMQKQIVLAKTLEQDCKDLIDQYTLKKSHFDHHPIVRNYLFSLEEVDNLLQFINNKINNEIIPKDTLD